jgi:hypothetical protein
MRINSRRRPKVDRIEPILYRQANNNGNNMNTARRLQELPIYQRSLNIKWHQARKSDRRVSVNILETCRIKESRFSKDIQRLLLGRRGGVWSSFSENLFGEILRRDSAERPCGKTLRRKLDSLIRWSLPGVLRKALVGILAPW